MENNEKIEWLNKKYIVPCFQREYSWDIEDIDELITDINYSNDDYCIGAIIVSKKDNMRRLIDGQQRLTTLYMIALACDMIKSSKKINLFYETDKILGDSNILVDLYNTIYTKKNKKENNYLYEKYKHIKDEIEKIKNEKFITKDFIKKLRNVYFYEIDLNDREVDLNHYFEVMNSRGMQLSRSDMIKSILMEKLGNDSQNDKKRLNNLWNSYEFMNKMKIKKFKDVKCKSEYKEKTISEILKNENYKKVLKKYEKKENINSILDFEYFLLYTIRLYREIKRDIIDDNKMFELKHLVNDFNSTFRTSTKNDISDFLDFLIDIKNIYDRKIIKRESVNTEENDDENWDLDDKKNQDIIEIQSCLRVSFTNKKLMKWIYETLKYYYQGGNDGEYVEFMKDKIREEYVEPFLKEAEKEEINYQTGFDTPHIVLNYLDYLLLKNHQKLEDIPYINELELDKFTFKFRNSIEHFLPRENDDKEKNQEWVNDFGNLALLAYGTNTKLQNASPEDKADHFMNNGLSRYSIKLQIMTKLTKEKEGWNKSKCEDLRTKLIKVLSDDLKNKN